MFYFALKHLIIKSGVEANPVTYHQKVVKLINPSFCEQFLDIEDYPL